MSTLIAQTPVTVNGIEARDASFGFSVLSLVALVVLGLVGAATVMLGVVVNVYAVSIAAGFVSAFGMLALVWREVFELAGK